MVEQFFWRMLIILLSIFASPAAFSASYYLQMHELSNMLSHNEIMMGLGIENGLYGVANVPLIIISSLRSGEIICAILLFVVSILSLVLYISWMNKRGKVWLESRRLHKSIMAMDVIFAFILFFAGYACLKENLVSNLYSSAIIFILSMIAMLKFKNKIPLFIYYIIAIGIAYFLI